MTIEYLEEMIKDCQKDGKSPFYCCEVGDIFKEIVNNFQSQQAQIKELMGRVKKLEQAQTYYPFTEEELEKEKIGGTD